MQSARNKIQSISEDDLSCPICCRIMERVMVTNCSHRFCYECIVKSIYKSGKQCPICRSKLTSKRQLNSEPDLDKIISENYSGNSVLNLSDDIKLILKPYPMESVNNDNHLYVVKMLKEHSLQYVETNSLSTFLS